MFSISKAVAVMQSFYHHTVSKILVYVFIAEHSCLRHWLSQQLCYQQGWCLWHHWWWGEHLRCILRCHIQESIIDEIHLVATTSSGTKVLTMVLSAPKDEQKHADEDKIKLINEEPVHLNFKMKNKTDKVWWELQDRE